uniref:Uncharacterized protein n=1 Tax=Ralstonia syzygii R24 TaxID=907261 RepID=G3A0E3_9RALS|nr:hypothetical protein RALSY_10614 [Ralstonia syzygii R24]
MTAPTVCGVPALKYAIAAIPNGEAAGQNGLTVSLPREALGGAALAGDRCLAPVSHSNRLTLTLPLVRMTGVTSRGPGFYGAPVTLTKNSI